MSFKAGSVIGIRRRTRRPSTMKSTHHVHDFASQIGCQVFFCLNYFSFLISRGILAESKPDEGKLSTFSRADQCDFTTHRGMAGPLQRCTAPFVAGISTTSSKVWPLDGTQYRINTDNGRRSGAEARHAVRLKPDHPIGAGQREFIGASMSSRIRHDDPGQVGSPNDNLRRNLLDRVFRGDRGGPRVHRLRGSDGCATSAA